MINWIWTCWVWAALSLPGGNVQWAAANSDAESGKKSGLENWGKGTPIWCPTRQPTQSLYLTISAFLISFLSFLLLLCPLLQTITPPPIQSSVQIIFDTSALLRTRIQSITDWLQPISWKSPTISYAGASSSQSKPPFTLTNTVSSLVSQRKLLLSPYPIHSPHTRSWEYYISKTATVPDSKGLQMTEGRSPIKHL